MAIPFSAAEAASVRYQENPFGGPPYPLFDYPLTPKENYLANMRGEGYWLPTTNDLLLFHPSIQPCHTARGAIEEACPAALEELGGKDMFAVEWVFDPVVFGSTVKPGKPLLDDANDWRKLVRFPDIDSWDWAGCAERNQDYLNTDKLVSTYFFSGYFERLISFMDFEGAAIALVDDEQKTAVKSLFAALTELYMALVDKYVEYFPGLIDSICLHDDWGAQRAPFFSAATVREMLMDEPKRLVKYIKSKGLLAESHCCGSIDSLIDLQVEIGYDRIEVQPMVNKDSFYERFGKTAMLTYSPDDIPGSPQPTPEQSRQAARQFVDKYFNKGTKCILEVYYTALTTEFLEELYIYSRQKSQTF
jgi:hypothetical protein